MHLPYTPPVHTELDILFQDNHLLVVNKPAGLLAVMGRGVEKQDCLATRVQAAFPDALVVHRLDMATSGLMLFARGATMQRQLSRLFEARSVEKEYIAVVMGCVPDSGEITLPLLADWLNRPKQKVDAAQGKPALTRYQRLDYEPATDTSHVRLHPITGRTHQLRVHLAAIGHPILGDTLYDGRAASRLHLHATRLAFAHPLDATYLALYSVADFELRI